MHSPGISVMTPLIAKPIPRLCAVAQTGRALLDHFARGWRSTRAIARYRKFLQCRGQIVAWRFRVGHFHQGEAFVAVEARPDCGTEIEACCARIRDNSARRRRW